MNTTRAKPGRKPKGDRTQVSAALPTEAVRIADARARREGVDRTAMLGRLLCEALGLEVPAYCLPAVTAQEELPLTKAS
jgi:hypothetical protein